MKTNRIILLLLCSFFYTICSANGLDEALRSNQKYYVVAAVLTCIFIGIVVFLVLIEKRLKKLEK